MARPPEWKVRTRALTTTLFARLFLGDLFIHGIGGAKYDELGDEVARGFLGAPPPPFLTLSLTLWLGLPDDPATTLSTTLDRALEIFAEAKRGFESEHGALPGRVQG